MLAYLSYRQVCVCTGKTVMVVMRIDGDCGCHPASDGDNECGVYRPYYQSYSSDDGQYTPCLYYARATLFAACVSHTANLTVGSVEL